MSTEKLSMKQLVRNWQEDTNCSRTEGRVGVENLCRLVRAIGYKDTQNFGQFSHDASYGDLINFLEDNQDAVEALIEFIEEAEVDEWAERLEVIDEEGEDDDEGENDEEDED